MPELRKLLSPPIQKRDRRAYVFFVILGGILFLAGVSSLTNHLSLKVLFLESIGDISLVLIYISLIINYIIRLKIYSDVNDIRSDSGRVYMWNIWSMKGSQCKQDTDRVSLLLSNYAIVLFLSIYFIWNLIQ